ncbi:Glycerophosphodiester phosphodiesterase domain-containing protein 1 [Trichoplax sp. H2]|nr:Glycerophosphodiester phosphodiesterase domain-containing protein 1 [Trichoplax sp. H2]|eukprot:RDD46469.1 Glycerophosphodiester phosphodiesterase domain-containing protein 1 [Trichoplax sp. H2]
MFYVFLGLSTYVATSIFFLYNPQLLHGKKKSAIKCRHISHRGGAAENLENTITAFKQWFLSLLCSAIDCDTDMLEIDLHITKDEQVVVSHDDYLSRSCQKAIYVNQTDYQDLPMLEPPLKVTFTKDDWCYGDRSDRKIALLSEVFDAFPNTPINMDLKVCDEKLIIQTDCLIRKYKRENITIWGSANDVVLQKLYLQNPEVPTFFSKRRVVITILLFYTGLLPFVPIKESYFEVIMPSIVKKVLNPELPIKSCAYAKFIDYLLMRPSLINHLKRRGIQVYLWVLNDENDFRRAFGLGADGIVTDYPTKLQKFLQKQKSD